MFARFVPRDAARIVGIMQIHLTLERYEGDYGKDMLELAMHGPPEHGGTGTGAYGNCKWCYRHLIVSFYGGKVELLDFEGNGLSERHGIPICI